MAAASAEKASFLTTLRKIGEDRSLLAMLLLGLGAGLPYAVLTGTINAWFTTQEVDVSTMGILSWIGLAYAFKFLWSPSLHRSRPLFFSGMGLRRAWILVFQLVILVAMGALAFLNPQSQLGLIAIVALLGVIASASQDIVIDAWRIESARDDAHLDVLSAIYQFGYRGAGFIGGMLALLLASRIGWSATLGLLAVAMLIAISGVYLAREPSRPDDEEKPRGVTLGGGLSPMVRNVALGVILLAWGWALFTLGAFMVETLTAEEQPSARDFIRYTGPWIVGVTVLLPALIGVLLLWLDKRASSSEQEIASETGLQAASDTLYRAILEPLMDLVHRLAWAAPLVLLLILSYRFTDLVWGSYAYVFYLGQNFGALGHTMDDVAIASKTIGVFMTFGGVALGGLALQWMGRMNALILGAVLAAATNLLFWDLALGAPFLDGLMEFTRLYDLFVVFGADERLSRLIIAIAGENIAVGIASVVFVAYLSSIVNPKYAAVQYALMASLTMLIGTLGRGALGELIEMDGYGFAYVFVLTAVLGLVAVAASIGEAVRQRFSGATAKTAEE